MGIAHIYNEKKETVWKHVSDASEIASALGEPVRMKELARLCALLHDVGKETVAFSEYIRIVTSEGGKWNRPKLNHSSAGGKWVYEKFAENSYSDRLTTEVVAWSIFSHHGIQNMFTYDGKDKFLERLCPQEDIYYEESCKNFFSACTEDLEILYERAKKECLFHMQRLIAVRKNQPDKKVQKEEQEKNCFALGMFLRLNLSILLESDRRSTAIFMGNRFVEDSFQRPQLWLQMQTRLKKYLEQLPAHSELNRLRSRIGQQCVEMAKEKTGIYILQIPTGGGKTVTSMQFALEHAIQHKKQRIFYIAPYKSILVQNAHVYRDIFQEENAIFEHHSDVIVGDEDLDSVRVLSETWNAPMILTTMVQFLNTLFNERSTHIRRMHTLTNSVIILDEIQAMPIKCIHLFNMAMNFLKQYGATIVLCSATQPLLEQVRRPIEVDKAMIQDLPQVFQSFRRTKLVDLRDVKNCRQIAELAGRQMQDHTSGIIIANTKKAVEEIYRMLSEYVSFDTKLYYLSNYLCNQHRLDVLHAFKASLAKKERAICVSTPLLEAGVDISAQWVIRTLTGWDSIIQAAGRCNRNQERSLGNVYLVRCTEENLDSLTDMRIGRESTEQLLDDYKQQPEFFENTLDSLSLMDAYYKVYFWKRADEMDYPVRELNTNLVKLLSIGNIEGRSNQREAIFHQAFRDAGEHFEVIESNTAGILVPYGKGELLIQEINAEHDWMRLQEKLKEAQRYTITIYLGERYQKDGTCFYALLSRGVVRKFDTCDAYYLRRDYFNQEIGINLESKMEELIF